jgi:hypothetical protein
MLDEYRALWRVLRRPMARWWRKTGAWWLAALLFLAAVDVALGGVLFPRFALSPGQPGALTSLFGLNIWDWGFAANVLWRLVELTAMLTAVMAASACLRIAATLVRDFPDPARSSRHSPLFLCALRQAMWPLAVIALLECTDPSRLISVYLCGLQLVPGWKPVHVLYESLQNIPWSTMLFTTWLIALLTAMRPRLILVLTWLVVSYVASTSFELLLALTSSAIPSWLWAFIGMPVPGSTIPVSHASQLHCGWLVGGALMILLIRASLKERPVWSYAIGSLMILASLIANFYVVIPTDIPDQRASKYNEILGLPQRTAISRTVDSLRFADSFATCTLAWCEFRTRTGRLPVKREDWGAYINSNIPCSWSIEIAPSPLYSLVLVPAVNAAYLALVIWFIAAVLLRVPTRVARAP